MAGEQVESLVREYRGWRYVVDDLFAEDAVVLAEDGWRVASTEWTLWDERIGCSGQLLNALQVNWPWRTPTRREWLLTVRYERP